MVKEESTPRPMHNPKQPLFVLLGAVVSLLIRRRILCGNIFDSPCRKVHCQLSLHERCCTALCRLLTLDFLAVKWILYHYTTFAFVSLRTIQLLCCTQALGAVGQLSATFTLILISNPHCLNKRRYFINAYTNISFWQFHRKYGCRHYLGKLWKLCPRGNCHILAM